MRAAFIESGLEPDIRVVPNRGRDIAPFLTVIEEAIGRYDLLGSRPWQTEPRTSNVDTDFGDRWRVFLWQHLIGDGDADGRTLLGRHSQTIRHSASFSPRSVPDRVGGQP